MKPVVIQFCVHNLCLVYHICHADVECEEFKNFVKGGRVKLFTLDFVNDIRVLERIGIIVGKPFFRIMGWCPPVISLQC